MIDSSENQGECLTPEGASLSNVINFLVSCPREVSYRCFPFDPGDDLFSSLDFFTALTLLLTETAVSMTSFPADDDEVKLEKTPGRLLLTVEEREETRVTEEETSLDDEEEEMGDDFGENNDCCCPDGFLFLPLSSEDGA